MESAVAILRRTLEVEASLKDLRGDPASKEKDIAAALTEIRSNYESLIINHPTLCRSKDINAQLWKQCFYFQIEEFRKSIKNLVTIIDSRSSVDSNKLKRSQERLVITMSNFKAFLGKTSHFYNNLLLALEKKMQECKARSRWTLDQEYENLCFSAHRSLIYLGDTARYWEMHIDEKKNWRPAEKCYIRALRFMPSSGHAHNQLAITAMYSETNLNALFHYCLSIMINDPFQTGITNLRLFYKKNSKFLRAQPQTKPPSRTELADGTEKLFISKFMHLHGILFESTCRYQDAISDDAVSYSTHLDDASLVEFGELLPSVLDQLPQLVIRGLLSEGTLMRMMAVSIFSAHRLLYSPELAASQGKGHSTAASYALVILFSFINRLALLADKYRKLVPLLLTPIVVFSEWVIRYKDVLLQQQQTSVLVGRGQGPQGRTGIWLQPASSDTILLENRSRSGMRTSLVSLINALDPGSAVTTAFTKPSKSLSSIAQTTTKEDLAEPAQSAAAAADQLYDSSLSSIMPSPLREFIELRGFTPLDERIEGYFSRYFFRDFKDLSALEPLKARNVRLFLLRQFVDKVLAHAPLLRLGVPPPDAPSDPRASDGKDVVGSGKFARRYPPGSSSAPLNRSRSNKTDKSSPPPSKRQMREKSKSQAGLWEPSKQRDRPAMRARVDEAAVSRTAGEVAADVGDLDAMSSRRRSMEEDMRDEEEESSQDKEALEGGSQSTTDLDADAGQVLNDDGAGRSHFEVGDNDADDDDDEIIVFKPAFSRYHQGESTELVTNALRAPLDLVGSVRSDSVEVYSNDWMGPVSNVDNTGSVSSALAWSLFGGSNVLSMDTLHLAPDEEGMYPTQLGPSSSPSFVYNEDVSVEGVAGSNNEGMLDWLLGDPQELLNDTSTSREVFPFLPGPSEFKFHSVGSARNHKASSQPPPGFEAPASAMSLLSPPWSSAPRAAPARGPPPGFCDQDSSDDQWLAGQTTT